VLQRGRTVADTCCDLRESLLARSVHHLVTLARELEALGVGLVITDRSIDTTTPTGRLLFTVLAAIAEFERELIRERVVAGVQRAKAKGKRLGRPPGARRQVQVERV
jgi:DNA invertase Pin-like site-specific DNA recombinase